MVVDGDVNETGTNVYVDETDTGTDSLNPDTDGDGICDGRFNSLEFVVLA